MRPKRLLSVLLFLFSLVYLGVGVAWTLMNVGDIPPYGDTGEYVDLSRALKVDQYRGILYPALLSVAEGRPGDPRFFELAALVRVQFLQLGVSLFCLAYFLYVVVDPAFLRREWGRKGVVWGLGFLLALLFFDPLVSHFNLSIMTDGLALSGSLAFCAALADLGMRRSPPLISGSVLLLSHLVTAGLRAEKNWVLLGTTITAIVLWMLWQRASTKASVPGLERRAAAALGIVVVAFVLVFVVHRSVYEDKGRWPLTTTILHHRIIFPNLTAVYKDLPPEVKISLSPQMARFYDTRIHNTWTVINQVTGRDAETRDRMTAILVGPVLKKRWLQIAGSILAATAENILAPFSFYGRLARWIREGESDLAFRVRFEGTPWTYYNLALHHPRLSRVFLSLSGGLFLVVVVLSFLRLRAFLGDLRGPLKTDTFIAIIPAAAFCAINGFAFSSTADLVHIRYVVFAHISVLLLLYLGAMHWLLSRPPQNSVR